MTVTTVSTYGSLQNVLQNMNSVQNQLNDAQEQVSSGKKSQTFDGISSSVEQLTSLNAQISRLTGYQQGNSVFTGQLQSTNTALGQIVQIATNVKGLVASQLSGTSSVASFDQQLQSQLSQLSSILNTTYGQNFIFGGTNTSTPPVKTPLPAPNQIGVPDASYYQGSTQDTTFRISDSQTITAGVRADNVSFQQVFAGIQQALSVTGGGADATASLTNAENLISQGLQGAIATQASVNANIVNVQQANTQSQTLQTYYQGIVTSLSSSDVVAMSTQVAQDTAVLQASFSAFARISSLSLVNFLK